MISKENFTKEHIENLRLKNNNAPSLLEKSVYAFGLLEAIQRVGMPFIFKGGTSLLLIQDKPMRLSTDIDIIVPPGTDVDHYIAKAGRIFPFLHSEEDVRIGRNKIEKRHYKFFYQSPLTGKEFSILLDVVFEDNPYNTVTDHPIQNDLLITEGENLSVQIPSINCILGDKLTAFAPHTTGIPLGIGKDLEVIKQMYDCAALFQTMDNFSEMKEVYGNVVQKELGYRGLSLRKEDVLADTIKSCFCIMGRGSINKDEYPSYADGIVRIQGHIFSGSFNGEWAGVRAASVLYLASAILTDKNYSSPDLIMLDDSGEMNKIQHIRKIKYIQKIDQTAFKYITAAYQLLDKNYFILE